MTRRRSPSATAEAVTGDLADEGSLVTAMAGIEKVFLLSSPHPDAVSWHRNAIDAARRTQVQLLVRSSILGADRESLRSSSALTPPATATSRNPGSPT